MNKEKKVIGEKCYNCDNVGVTREHAIPKFILSDNEEALTIPCCKYCQEKLNWLDNYGADYFRYYSSSEDIEKQEKAFQRFIINNGSAMSIRYFSDKTTNKNEFYTGGDIVVDEDLLVRFIHKVCVGVSYRLYGKLDDTYSLYIITNFSKLGGYCEYNNPNDRSYTKEQTIQLQNARSDFYNKFKCSTIDIYGRQFYKSKYSLALYTSKRVFDAYWFNLIFFNNFRILCAVTNADVKLINNARNMLLAAMPIRINIEELDQCQNKVKCVERGDSLSTELLPYPADKELRAIFKSFSEDIGLHLTNKKYIFFEEKFISFFKNKFDKNEWDKQSLGFLKKMFRDGLLTLERKEVIEKEK